MNADLIQLDRVSKRFGGVRALNEVSFGIRSGEIHAVVGENGAGKSTLMKLLAGVHTPDAGEIRLAGQPVRLGNPREARRQGISIVFQEPNLFPQRSVAANVFVNRERVGRLGLVKRRAMNQATCQVLRAMEVSLGPEALVGPLSIAERQLVEIARTLQQESRIIILDEPNSALTEAESQRLFDIVRRLRAQGRTIIYVSHRLEEVFAIADRITIIRDGSYQGTFRTSDSSIPEVIAAMIGRRLDHSFPPLPPLSAEAPVVLKVRELCHSTRLGPISFDARAGEILGFTGLEGAGVDELFRVLFGLEPATGGQIIYRDRPQRLGSPRQAIRLGWGLVPESRRDQGLMMDWSIARNTTLLVLDKLLNWLGLIDKKSVRATAEQFVRRLGIVADSQDMKVVNLSGGNQQKVLLAKWLATGPRLLILNDPTRGVDVGAKWEIYKLCRQLAAEGLAILLSSSDVDEILGLADRVLVLHKGSRLQEFQRHEATKAQLMSAMSGAAKHLAEWSKNSAEP
jgi:ABC-type sugar transport system ATPase subunit